MLTMKDSLIESDDWTAQEKGMKNNMNGKFEGSQRGSREISEKLYGTRVIDEKYQSYSDRHFITCAHRERFFYYIHYMSWNYIYVCE